MQWSLRVWYISSLLHSRVANIKNTSQTPELLIVKMVLALTYAMTTNLCNDVCVGETHYQSILWSVVLRLILSDQTLASTIISLTLCGLKTMEYLQTYHHPHSPLRLLNLTW